MDPSLRKFGPRPPSNSAALFAALHFAACAATCIYIRPAFVMEGGRPVLQRVAFVCALATAATFAVRTTAQQQLALAFRSFRPAG